VNAAAKALKPPLIVQGADRPATAEALKDVLAAAPECFDRGGLPVQLVAPADGGLPVAKRMTHNNVIHVAHRYCRPVKRSPEGKLIPITLPENVARMYLDLGNFGLRPLAGVTSAPLLRADGRIMTSPGYNRELALWCEPVPSLHVPAKPTMEQAAAAVLLIRERFRTFPFRDSPTISHGALQVIDLAQPPGLSESSFLAGLLTAVCRPSLHLAPGLLVTAPEVTGAGSGKGLMVRAINAIAFGSQPAAFTPGHDKQELDKRLVAELIMAGPAVFLDNCNSMALESTTLASVLTERPARVRIMGLSEMVPLNSAAFIAVTGNGLSVTEDLARRFISVDLDPQCEDPESRPFKPGFVNEVKNNRAELLSAALVILRWGRQNTLAPGLTLGSYETWSEWVRDPLLALGCADPVARIREAKASDPRRQLTADLFRAWFDCHCEIPVKASELAEPVLKMINPQGRSRQYVAERLKSLDGTRAAGLMLTRQPPAGKWSPATYAVKSVERPREA
jgi:hypothetical protein